MFAFDQSKQVELHASFGFTGNPVDHSAEFLGTNAEEALVLGNAFKYASLTPRRQTVNDETRFFLDDWSTLQEIMEMYGSRSKNNY